MADSGAYRSVLEVAELQTRDPLETFRQQGLKAGWFDQAACELIINQVQEVVDDAIQFAEESPTPTDLAKDVYIKPLNLYGTVNETSA
jgi:pyruvate dehydrogenase E1 component alpha subunit